MRGTAGNQAKVRRKGHADLGLVPSDSYHLIWSRLKDPMLTLDFVYV